MICHGKQYRYKIVFGVSGEQHEVQLTKDLELTRKPQAGEMFYRTESPEWTMLRWKNPTVYDLFITALSDVEAVDYPIYALVHYYADTM